MLLFLSALSRQGTDGALKEKQRLRLKTEQRVTATGPLAELVVSKLSGGR